MPNFLSVIFFFPPGGGKSEFSIGVGGCYARQGRARRGLNCRVVVAATDWGIIGCENIIVSHSRSPYGTRLHGVWTVTGRSCRNSRSIFFLSLYNVVMVLLPCGCRMVVR